MARNDTMWQKVKKTIGNEIQDEEKLAGNLAGKDLCVIVREIFTGELPLRDVMSSLNTCVKAHCVEHLGDPAIPLEELRLASEKFRREVGDRIFEKRLLRAVALFAGSVFVMRNFGELMAV